MWIREGRILSAPSFEMEPEEGKTYQVYSDKEWKSLNPVTGQVVEVNLATSTMDAGVETWSGFFIADVVVEETGDELRLGARCVGCEDEEMGKKLGEKFKKKGGAIHLCGSAFCGRLDLDSEPTIHV